MRTIRIILIVCAWLVSPVCVAGAPAGPAAADAILRQNPQIKTLAGVPGNLKGASVKDCPAGGRPDISRSRCVVAYVPGAAQPYEKNYGVVQSFVLVLHPNSPKVWGVFKKDATKPGKTDLLGEFDMNGHLVAKGASVPNDKEGGALAGAAEANVTSSAATQKQSAAQRDKPAVVEIASPTPFGKEWFGTWRGTEQISLEISASAIKYKYMYQDEGVRTPRSTLCKWSPMKDALRDAATGNCLFSASQQAKSKEEIAPAFEKTARDSQSWGFDAMVKRSRQALAAMKSGQHNVLLLNDSGEVQELVFDGEHVLLITPYGDGYRAIELLTRVVSGKRK